MQVRRLAERNAARPLPAQVLPFPLFSLRCSNSGLYLAPQEVVIRYSRGDARKHIHSDVELVRLLDLARP